MAAKKARKRAYIPPSHEVANRRERTTSARPASRVQRTTAAGPRQRGAAQPYPQPSIKRTLKRLPIYFVLIFGLQMFVLRESVDETGQRLLIAFVQAGVITLFFAPFMHMMDRFAYNRWLKRTGGTPPTKQP